MQVVNENKVEPEQQPVKEKATSQKLWQFMTIINILLFIAVATFVYLSQEEVQSLSFNNHKGLKQQAVQLQAILTEIEKESKNNTDNNLAIKKLSEDLENKINNMTKDISKISELAQKETEDVQINTDYKIRYFISLAAVELQYFENKLKALIFLDKALKILENDERSKYRVFGYKLKNYYRELEGITITNKTDFIRDIKFLKSQLIHEPATAQQLDKVIEVVESRGDTGWGELKDLIKIRRQDPRLKPIPSSLGTEFEAKRFELLLEQAILAVILKNQEDYDYTMSLIKNSGNNLAISNLVRMKEKFLHIINTLTELKLNDRYPDLMPLIEEFDNV